MTPQDLKSSLGGLDRVASVLARSDAYPDKWIPVDSELELLTQVDRGAKDEWVAKLEKLVDKIAPLEVIESKSQRYPQNLKRVPGRPSLLFSSGALIKSDDRAVAIVGSRDADPAAIEAAELLGRELAARGFTIVSGLARGVDTAAHRGALKSNGRTIAVLGTGIGRTFPSENASLARKIQRNGALISQFPPMFPGTKTTFPARNAVIAGLSLGSVVVMAERRSGTRIEINFSLAQGRPVLLWAPLLKRKRWAIDLVSERSDGLVHFVDTVDEIEQELVKRRT
jgi:DNA processing protein